MARLLGYVALAAAAALWTGCGGGGGGGGSSSSQPSTSAIDASTKYSPAPDPGYYGIPSTALGPVVNAAAQTVTFNYWNPDATTVVVNLYNTWNESLSAPDATVAMTRGAAGVWSSAATPLPAQNFYVYAVDGTSVLDPYARSMAEWQHTGSVSISGDSTGKGAILDPAAIGPDGGTTLGYFDGSAMLDAAGAPAPYAYASNRDAIIYEAGVRDLTVDPFVTGFKPGHTWGTFKGLVDMLPHIQKLGVTHVQLLCPLENYTYDQTKIGTRELDNTVTSGANYNWGYDPQNYFTPTGMYSAAPSDPAARVNELKTLINEIHRQGMGVILDVVFNHTANNAVLGDSVLPGYYYRSTSDNGAGSRDVASENKMVRKLIVDSVSQWVVDYKVDGFRFDLMGVLDTQTLKDAYSAATAANPLALFLGEGWNGFYGGAATDYNGAAIESSDQNDDAAFAGLNVGMFSDSYRNIFKNGYPSDGSPAFLTGSAQSATGLLANAAGAPTNFTAPSTNNVVNYLTCHDNLCYYDVLAAATLSKAGAAQDALLLKRAKVGYAVLFTSQGTAFIQAGDEMFRTKETPASSAANAFSNGVRTFVDNSYNASDAINMVAWDRVYAADPIAGGFANYDATQDGFQLYAYTQGLIALRKSTNAFRLPDAAIAANFQAVPSDVTGASTLAFGYQVRSTDAQPATYYVLHNADTVAHTFTVSTSLTGAVLLVDGNAAGLVPITASTTATLGGNGLTVTVAPLTSALFKN